jgi:hypothetical protein
MVDIVFYVNQVELRCKQSVGPIKYPLIDNFDSDPNDHILVTYCMYPQFAGTQGS